MIGVTLLQHVKKFQEKPNAKGREEMKRQLKLEVCMRTSYISSEKCCFLTGLESAILIACPALLFFLKMTPLATIHIIFSFCITENM